MSQKDMIAGPTAMRVLLAAMVVIMAMMIMIVVIMTMMGVTGMNMFMRHRGSLSGSVPKVA